MKKELFQKITIPEGIEAKIEGSEIVIKGPEGELRKNFKTGKMDFEIKDGKIIIGDKKSTKTEKKMMNTIKAHIKNMIKGVQKKFEYQLKICFSHFPFTVKMEGNQAIIKNFLGEKVDRQCPIPKNVEVKLEKDIIVINSTDKELAGQAAANFETATKIRGRDRRIFQGGIFMINKAG